MICYMFFSRSSTGAPSWSKHLKSIHTAKSKCPVTGAFASHIFPFQGGTSDVTQRRNMCPRNQSLPPHYRRFHLSVQWRGLSFCHQVKILPSYFFLHVLPKRHILSAYYNLSLVFVLIIVSWYTHLIKVSWWSHTMSRLGRLFRK